MTAHPLPDTFWTTGEELALFGGACLLGIPAGLLLDVFRLLRRCVRHPVIAVAAEDVLWLLGVTGLLLCYASACAKGVFRGYYAAGCLLGCIVYELTLGEPALRLLMLLLLPFRTAARWISAIFTKMRRKIICFIQNFKRGKENAQNRLQCSRKKVYNKKRTKIQKRRGTTYGKKKKSIR